MHFQTAGIDVAPWIPPLVAFVISFFTSMGGVSGAFLILPFQVSVLGFSNPSVSSTNQLYNLVAIPSGVYRYMREGRMVWPLTWAVIAGTLPGVFIGAYVRIRYLPDQKNFKLFAALVLLYIGSRLIKDILKAGGGSQASEQKFRELVGRYSKKDAGKESLPVVRVVQFSMSRIEYEFYGEKFGFPVWGILTLSFIVGIVGGIYGIGGGAIIAPFFVTFFKLPVYTVAGAALMGTLITSVAGVIFYQTLAPYYPGMSIAPDWMLGLLFGIGGMGGMYLGARCQKYVPAKVIKWMLGLIIVFTALKYISEFLM